MTGPWNYTQYHSESAAGLTGEMLNKWKGAYVLFLLGKLKINGKTPIKLTSVETHRRKKKFSEMSLKNVTPQIECERSDLCGLSRRLRGEEKKKKKRERRGAVSSWCFLALTWCCGIVRLVILLCCFQLFIPGMPMKTPTPLWVCKMCSFVCEIDPLLHTETDSSESYT